MMSRDTLKHQEDNFAARQIYLVARHNFHVASVNKSIVFVLVIVISIQ